MTSLAQRAGLRVREERGRGCQLMRMRFFLVLFLVDQLVSAQVSPSVSPSSSMSPWFGVLQSPNFPDPYPRETTMQWNLSVPDGFHVKLYFSHFDLEPSFLCEYDYVKVEAEGELLGLFCGREDSDTEAVPAQQVIVSPTNSLSIVFCSDFSDEERFSGFRAHYSAADVDECSERADEDQLCDHFCHNYIGGYYCSCRHGYLLHSDNHTCRVECSGSVYRERSGVLSSVDFPAPYPKSSECVYVIEVEAGFRLRLQFDSIFDVENHPDVSCPYDHVKIKAGSSEFGPFCGDQSPGIIQTDANMAAIFFHSDNSGENRGWRLTYTSVGSQCPKPERPDHALLNPDQSEYFFRDHILFTCSPGFRLLKDGQYLDHYQMACEADGSWSGSPPLCQMVDCGSPKVVAMAEVVFGHHDNNTLFGATLQYVCKDDALQLSPTNGSYSCGPDGEWTHLEVGTDPPACLPACGRPARPLPPQVKRIVGGRSAEPGLFPWQVLLSVEDLTRVPEDRWFGSGALLSESWVLTAAHVLRSQRRDASVVPVAPENVKVFLGLHNARDIRGAVMHSAEQVLLHPDFRPNNYDNDIAMVKLRPRAEFNELVRPVCLPPPHGQDAPMPPPNSLGIVAGWGISNRNASSLTSDPAAFGDLGVASDLLQYVKLPVVPQDECRASYASRSVRYNISDNMFCAGFLEGGRDTCLGDSGGGFVMEGGASGGWAVFGLVSWGGPEECGTQRVYGVYTRVAKYLSWIHTLLHDTSTLDAPPTLG